MPSAIRTWLLVLALTLCALIIAPPAHADPDSPTLRALDAAVGQAVIVTAPSWHSSHATLTAFERTSDGTWKRVISPTPARIGETGMIKASRRLQDTGKTPAGTFAITSAFGRKADPGTQLPYIAIDRNDTWPYWRGDPSTYNVMQTHAFDDRSYGKFIEHLWRKGRQYDYVAVLDYNLPHGGVTTDDSGIHHARIPANTRKGGGIFLHVTDGRSTAGCIAIPKGAMIDVLRWLDPAEHPVIVTEVR